MWQHLHTHMTDIVTTIHIHVCTNINYFEYSITIIILIQMRIYSLKKCVYVVIANVELYLNFSG